MNRRYIFILILIAAAALPAYLYFFPKDDGTNETAKVEKKRYIKSVYASGYVDSVNKVQIKPEVSGYIATINVKEGDRVKKGEVIATIKNDKLQEQLREISAKRDLIENRMKEDSPFLRALKDEIAIWKMNTEIERRNFERRESLFEKGIISKEDFDKSKQGLEVTEKTYAKSLEGLNDQLASLKSELDSLTASEQAVV
ncbi:MAG: biotin/lipoyl-binding protein, partial [Candidatus Dadabacteria bacterium]|nr:biotin/lipoyl-binding protein [Candidatus Dadabacteria bacterium]